MKIKINWGVGLMIGMGAFISFIMYFVITMLSSKEFDHDLVVEDYYKAELHYQQDIDAEKNALALEDHIQVKKDGSRLIIEFPEKMQLSKISGAVSMYRPSNKQLDFTIPLNDLKDWTLEVPEDKMIGGRWNIFVNWKYDGKDYLFKKEILY